jgi:hypothetical protein
VARNLARVLADGVEIERVFNEGEKFFEAEVCDRGKCLRSAWKNARTQPCAMPALVQELQLTSCLHCSTENRVRVAVQTNFREN